MAFIMLRGKRLELKHVPSKQELDNLVNHFENPRNDAAKTLLFVLSKCIVADKKLLQSLTYHEYLDVYKQLLLCAVEKGIMESMYS